MTTNHAVEILLKERQAVAADVADLNARLRENKAKMKELDEAIAQLGGECIADVPHTTRRISNGTTLRDLVLNQLPDEGADNGPSPNEIARILTNSGRETTNTSVSATLSRLKNDEGIVVKIDGQWFKKINAGNVIVAAEKNEGPAGPSDDGETSSGVFG